MKEIISRDKLWAIIIGIGIALTPIHNVWLTKLVTTNGVVEFFIPSFGIALWVIGSVSLVGQQWEKLNWGSKFVYIPLLVIVLFMGINGFVFGDTIVHKFAPLLMGVSLFAVYLSARYLGEAIFLVFIPAVILDIFVAIIQGIVIPGIPAYGIITEGIASGCLIILGSTLIHNSWRWGIVALGIMGIFFIGNLEPLFVLGVMFLAVIGYRDSSYRLFITLGAFTFLVLWWSALGYLIPLWSKPNISMLYDVAQGSNVLSSKSMQVITSYRWERCLEAIRNASILGHGYTLTYVGGGLVHNTPLIIMEQIGVPASIAWVFVSIYCLIKTGWKYTWIAVLALSVWGHYLWTQFIPLWWAIVGVTLTSNLKSDFIFLGAKNEVNDDNTR